MSGDVSQTGVNNLFWTGTVLWVVLWAMFVIRLAWLDARLRVHLTKHHPHRWRRLSWSERLTWSVWFVFQSKEDYGDPVIGARRREMLTVFFDMLLVLAATIVWFVISAAKAQLGP
jgi:hypothetical protein